MSGGGLLEFSDRARTKRSGVLSGGRTKSPSWAPPLSPLIPHLCDVKNDSMIEESGCLGLHFLFMFSFTLTLCSLHELREYTNVNTVDAIALQSPRGVLAPRTQAYFRPEKDADMRTRRKERNKTKIKKKRC